MGNTLGLQIYGMGVGNYRSFCSDEIARVGPCEKVHVLTGQNNTGKSSLLQAYQKLMSVVEDYQTENTSISYFGEKDLPDRSRAQEFEMSVCLSIKEVIDWIDGLVSNTDVDVVEVRDSVKRLLTSKAYSDTDSDYCWINLVVERKGSSVYLWPTPTDVQFKNALSDLDDNAEKEMLIALGRVSEHIEKEELRASSSYQVIVYGMIREIVIPEVVIIPAVRRIQKLKKDGPDIHLDPSGIGFPEKLLRLTNHSAENHEDAMACIGRFERLVRRVLNEPNMSYSVDFDTHQVSFQTEGSPMLPIEGLGTGIEELLVLALTVATTHDSVICIEEPEIHLHPTLIRRLVECLQQDECGNRFILSTHSPTLINAPGVSVTHVIKRDGVSYARTVSGITEGRNVLDDIGVRASDILMADYVIWVEGPSDRIYVNAWIHELDSTLREAIHYSIVTYGGKLLSGFTAGGDGGRELEKLIQLMRVNPHFCVLMDSDVTSSDGEINETKKRIVAECHASANLPWVTWGATIENYYPGERIASALQELYPGESYSYVLDDRYVHPLGSPFDSRKVKSPDKVRVAHKLVETSILDSDSRDTALKDKVSLLVKEIRKASQI